MIPLPSARGEIWHRGWQKGVAKSATATRRSTEWPSVALRGGQLRAAARIWFKVALGRITALHLSESAL